MLPSVVLSLSVYRIGLAGLLSDSSFLIFCLGTKLTCVRRKMP